MKLLSIVVAVLVPLAVKAGQSPCSYKGSSYDHSPGVAVTGDTRICYCNDGQWEKCYDKPPVGPGSGSSGSGSSGSGSSGSGSSGSGSSGSGSSGSGSSTGPDSIPITETEEAFRGKFPAKNFTYDLRKSPVVSTGKGGTLQLANLADFPILAGQGVSFALVNLEPCAINLPHVHPRATELLFVIKGKNLQTVLIEENDGRTLVNEISAGQLAVFPRGLLHFETNFGCEPLEFISAFSSDDPGVLTVVSRLVTGPNEALETTFGVSPDQLASLKMGIPAGPAQGRAECLQRCRLGAPPGQDGFYPKPL